jgi:hypothetical protein
MGLIILEIIGLALCLLILGSAQLYAATVLIHHTGHGQGVRPKWLGRLIDELAGILLLRQTVTAYKTDHGFHHGKRTFARGSLDPDAAFLERIGFRPGDSVEISNRKLRKILFSPRFHGKFILKRLLMNFARKAEPLRTVSAWVVWTAIYFTVSQNGLLLEFGLLLIFSMFIGNIASLLELVSRHKWLIEVKDGVDRQWALSHARFYGAFPPEKGASFKQWLIWVCKISLAVIEKLLVAVGDLQWHLGHHIGWDRKDYEGEPKWVNPQYAYARHITELTDDKVYLSTYSAVQAWFEELAKAPVKHQQ